jgi:glycosyltransferase involved in cell wall biosynthesis
MKVSVVIRSYNEDEHIERLFLGLRAQRQRPHEVIVVDSGSTDRTVEIAKRYADKIVSIDKREFTFGRALNRGIAAATGDICLFPSAHVYPTYDTWIEKIAAPFKDERVVLAYGRQRGGERNKFSEHQIFARWFPAESVSPQRGYFCNNANCAVRRSAWESRPYDETLTGLEDLAWAKGAQEAGGWLAYVAEAEIVHVHDESWAQVRNRYRREAMAMRVIDDSAKFTMLDFLWLLPSNVFADFGAAIQRKVFRREFAPILLFRYNQMLGTYLGYNGRHEVSTSLRQRFYYPTDPKDRREDDAEQERHRIDYDALKAASDGERVVRIASDKR